MSRDRRIGLRFGASVLPALLLLLAVGGAVGGAAQGASAPTAWVWTERPGSPAPPAAAGTLLAYDSLANRFVFFGGWNGSTLNQTWEYDPTASMWTELHPPISPVSRADATFVFDASTNEFVLFGGWTQYVNGTVHRLNDTWTFSLGSDQWTELHPTGSPSPRSDSAAAYDPSAGVIYLYGGFSGLSYLGDSWTFDPTTMTWTPIAPIGPTPGIRSDGRMVYDSSTDEFILFGGNDFNGPNLTFHHLNDTWAYRLSSNQWSLIPTPIAPPARDYAVEGFDPVNATILLFSGYGNRTILDDTWAFSTTTESWAELGPVVSPPGRYAGGGAFDTDDGVFVIVGGLGDSGLLNDTWSLGPEAPTPGGGGVVPSGGGEVPWVAVAAFVGTGLLLAGLTVRVGFAVRKGRAA